MLEIGIVVYLETVCVFCARKDTQVIALSDGVPIELVLLDFVISIDLPKSLDMPCLLHHRVLTFTCYLYSIHAGSDAGNRNHGYHSFFIQRVVVAAAYETAGRACQLTTECWVSTAFFSSSHGLCRTCLLNWGV